MKDLDRALICAALAIRRSVHLQQPAWPTISAAPPAFGRAEGGESALERIGIRTGSAVLDRR
jgi:hypothetical protein